MKDGEVFLRMIISITDNGKGKRASIFPIGIH